MKSSGAPLDNRMKTAPLAIIQLYEYENQTLETFVAASRLYAKFELSLIVQWLATSFHF